LRGLLRLLAAAIFVCAVLHISALLASKDARIELMVAAELFIKAKLFGWLVTEPGALLWTFFTLWSFCPILLPQQSLENPRPSGPAVVVDPVAVVDGSKIKTPLMASSP